MLALAHSPFFWFAAVLLFLFWKLSGSTSESGGRAPYRSRHYLVSEAERKFLQALDAAVGDRYRVFTKVRLADVVEVTPGVDKVRWKFLFNRIIRKHVDFTLCHRDMRIACAIELDDHSHSEPERRVRDLFVDEVFDSAGIPLLRFPARAGYDVAEIKLRLAEAVGQPVDCPKCKSPMVRRQARSGPRAGSFFWGCTKYPACSGIINA